MELFFTYKNPKGSTWNYLILKDIEGYEVHRIVRSFDENLREGFNGRWEYKDAYLKDNRVWLTKFDDKEERLVSYPIKHSNKYYVKKVRGKLIIQK